MGDRKKKTSDKDIKAFFGDYAKATGRRKVLLAKTHARPMSITEANEYKDLGQYLQCVDAMIDTLEPLVAKIIRDYYINHNTLFNISMEINYCYEHVSYLKNLGCDNIRKMLSGKDILSSKYSKTLSNAIIKVMEEL